VDLNPEGSLVLAIFNTSPALQPAATICKNEGRFQRSPIAPSCTQYSRELGRLWDRWDRRLPQGSGRQGRGKNGARIGRRSTALPAYQVADKLARGTMQVSARVERELPSHLVHLRRERLRHSVRLFKCPRLGKRLARPQGLPQPRSRRGLPISAASPRKKGAMRSRSPSRSSGHQRIGLPSMVTHSSAWSAVIFALPPESREKVLPILDQYAKLVA
jgi:hypothetical protein